MFKSVRGYYMDEKLYHENELIQEIKSKITDAGGGSGDPVYLDGVSYFETRKSSTGSANVSINCIFINEEGEICADLYRSGTAGFFDFICGKKIYDLSERGLREVLYALDNDLWYVKETVEKEKTESKGQFRFSLRLPFLYKGI
jgi:hypothetical protein